MKKTLLLGISAAAFLLSQALLSAQGAATHYRTVNPQWDTPVSVFMEKHGRGRAQQGLEMYGNYIFSLEDGGHVNVYDFKTASPEPIGGFELASSRPDNHANNAEFGIEKKKGSQFPLMYISNGKVGSDIEWTCFVESITLKKGKWSSEIAQTIVLDGCKGWEEKGYAPIFGAPSWLVDRDRKHLWVFSAAKRTVAAVTHTMEENQYVAVKFRIPRLSEGQKVVLTVDDILDHVVFPYDIWFTQAGCVKDGKLFYCYGVGKYDWGRPSAIRVYDTDQRKISASYNLQNEVIYEMEDLVIRDGDLYVNTNTSSASGIVPLIYKVGLPKDNTLADIPRDFMAHRGVHLGSTVAGENSLEAIDLARRAGFKYIETDCRWTRDSVMVIMHDAALNRTCVRADGSPLGKKKVMVADLSFEELRRDYRLKADRPGSRTLVPTLEEYLVRCKEQGFGTVLIEPKLKDSTGVFYKDLIRIADKTVGRRGYLVVSNNFANGVIRKTKKFKDVGLMGLLYQTDYPTMDALGNTVFALSSNKFTPQEFEGYYCRAKSEGKFVESACGLRSATPQGRFDSYMLVKGYGDGIDMIATDLNTPDYRGQGKVVADLGYDGKSQDFLKALSSLPVSELYGIYFDMEYSGAATVCVGPDEFAVNPSAGKASYSRTVYNCVPNVSITPGEGFEMTSCRVRVVQL